MKAKQTKTLITSGRDCIIVNANLQWRYNSDTIYYLIENERQKITRGIDGKPMVVRITLFICIL